MRALRVLARVAGGLALLLALAGLALLLGLNTAPGRRLAEQAAAQATGGMVRIAGLAGTFPTALRIGRLEIADASGVWLTVQDAALDVAPLRLLAAVARIDTLTATRVAVARLPAPAGPASSGGLHLPLRVELLRLRVERLELAAPVAGSAAALAVDGRATLAALWRGEAAVTLVRLDAPGSYALDGRIDAAGLHARLRAAEPAGGLVGQAAGLPGLGAIDATAALDGSMPAASLQLSLAAGALRAQAEGMLNLDALSGDLELSASAPAMQPRPDLSWAGIALQARLHGRFAAPEATATLTLDRLATGGAALQRLSVQAEAHAEQATLDATAEGLRLPGRSPDLLAAAPLRLTAEAALAAPGRPVRFVLAHPLARVEGTARTDAALSVQATVALPDLAPLAAAGGADIRGRATLAVAARQDATGTQVDLDGTLGITGGRTPLPGLLGPAAKLSLSAVLDGADLVLSRLALEGRALAATAQGSVRKSVVTLDSRIAFSDLSVLADRLAGGLVAQLHAAGRADDVSGALTAEGRLDGAPLALAAQAARTAEGALQLTIARADWRSLHAEGALDLPAGAALPLGTLRLRIGALSDVAPLAGRALAGSVEATLRTEAPGGSPVAVLDATAREAGLPGQAMVAEAGLTARLRDRAGRPLASARLRLAGLRAGEIGGGLVLQADGPADGLALTLAAGLTGVGGADLAAQGAARLDASARTLSVASLQAVWKSETLRLLAPARLTFADGLAVDRARFGLREAVLEVAGRVAPTLDLTAGLHNVTAELARILVPALQAEGRLEADAKLAGTLARPAGTLRLAASGLRLRSGAAAGLPAAGLTATATLQGGAAGLDAALTAGRNRLAVTGTVPLQAAGAMELHATGELALATFNPILAVAGRRAAGQLRLDATITGPPVAPRASGSLLLAGGEVEDVALGAGLHDIGALLQAEGDTLRLARFTARAGGGTLAAGGTLGLAAPMPLEAHAHRPPGQPAGQRPPDRRAGCRSGVARRPAGPAAGGREDRHRAGRYPHPRDHAAATGGAAAAPPRPAAAAAARSPGYRPRYRPQRAGAGVRARARRGRRAGRRAAPARQRGGTASRGRLSPAAWPVQHRRHQPGVHARRGGVRRQRPDRPGAELPGQQQQRHRDRQSGHHRLCQRAEDRALLHPRTAAGRGAGLAAVPSERRHARSAATRPDRPGAGADRRRGRRPRPAGRAAPTPGAGPAEPGQRRGRQGHRAGSRAHRGARGLPGRAAGHRRQRHPGDRADGPGARAEAAGDGRAEPGRHRRRRLGRGVRHQRGGELRVRVLNRMERLARRWRLY